MDISLNSGKTTGLYFDKTGQEIVDACSAKCAYMQGKADMLQAMYTAIENSARVKPNEFFPTWYYGGFEHKMPTLCRYSYELLIMPQQLEEMGYTTNTTSLTPENAVVSSRYSSPAERCNPEIKISDLCKDITECQERSNYNQLVTNWLEMYVELCNLQIVCENINVEAGFRLNEYELQKLGF